MPEPVKAAPAKEDSKTLDDLMKEFDNIKI